MAENIPVPEGQVDGGGVAPAALSPPPNPSELIASKRQRRPSVRLGYIRDHAYDSHPRRTSKSWHLVYDGGHHNHHRKDLVKASKTRPLTNLSSGLDCCKMLISKH